MLIELDGGRGPGVQFELLPVLDHLDKESRYRGSTALRPCGFKSDSVWKLPKIGGKVNPCRFVRALPRRQCGCWLGRKATSPGTYQGLFALRLVTDSERTAPRPSTDAGGGAPKPPDGQSRPPPAPP